MWTMFVTTSVGVLTYFKTVNVDYVSPVLYAYGRFILTMNYLHTSRTPYFSGDEDENASP